MHVLAFLKKCFKQNLLDLANLITCGRLSTKFALLANSWKQNVNSLSEVTITFFFQLEFGIIGDRVSVKEGMIFFFLSLFIIIIKIKEI